MTETEGSHGRPGRKRITQSMTRAEHRNASDGLERTNGAPKILVLKSSTRQSKGLRWQRQVRAQESLRKEVVFAVGSCIRTRKDGGAGCVSRAQGSSVETVGKRCVPIWGDRRTRRTLMTPHPRDLLRGLDPRERAVLVAIYEHKVLLTEHLKAMFSGSLRRAQDRLRHLAQCGLIDTWYPPSREA